MANLEAKSVYYQDLTDATRETSEWFLVAKCPDEQDARDICKFFKDRDCKPGHSYRYNYAYTDMEGKLQEVSPTR